MWKETAELKRRVEFLVNEVRTSAERYFILQTALDVAKSSTITARVKAFHEKFGHPVREKPAVPSTEEVRFRARLITEEYLEFMGSIFEGTESDTKIGLISIEKMLKQIIEQESVAVDDLPETADALADLAYVIEGTNLVFGIDSQAVLVEVQRANMSKEVASVHAKDNYHKTGGEKPIKPKGWEPPDIADVLRQQGWSDAEKNDD